MTSTLVEVDSSPAVLLPFTPPPVGVGAAVEMVVGPPDDDTDHIKVMATG
jgi:hypothetical protein